MGGGGFNAAAAAAVIGGADGPTAILIGNGAAVIPLAVAWAVTLVTLYSGWDYLRKNWDLIREGASRPKA